MKSYKIRKPVCVILQLEETAKELVLVVTLFKKVERFLKICFVYGSALLPAGLLQLPGVGGATLQLWGAGFSLWRLLVLRDTGSRALTQELWRVGSAVWSMWELPGPGIEPVSPALAGGCFFTTEPPGKPLGHHVSGKPFWTSLFTKAWISLA